MGDTGWQRCVSNVASMFKGNASPWKSRPAIHDYSIFVIFFWLEHFLKVLFTPWESKVLAEYNVRIWSNLRKLCNRIYSDLYLYQNKRILIKLHFNSLLNGISGWKVPIILWEVSKLDFLNKIAPKYKIIGEIHNIRILGQNGIFYYKKEQWERDFLWEEHTLKPCFFSIWMISGSKIYFKDCRMIW